MIYRDEREKKTIENCDIKTLHKIYVNAVGEQCLFYL